MNNVIGRVTLFHVDKTGKYGQPDYRGYMDTDKGKYSISLWAEPNDKVTGGEILKGQITRSTETL